MDGLLFGALIGDAMGIQFKFSERKKLKAINHRTLKYGDSQIFDIQKGDWSEDGDFIILLLQTMHQRKHKTDIISYCTYANKLDKWYRHGITALDKAIERSSPSKSNGALCKMALIGLSSKNKRIVVSNTINLCLIENCAEIVKSACICMALLVFYIEKQCVTNWQSMQQIDALCSRIFVDVIGECKLSTREMISLRQTLDCNSLSALWLGEDCNATNCLKTLGCAYWAIRNIDDGFASLLAQIYSEGGDTDSNGCAAGAIVGFIVGVDELPSAWLHNLKHKAFVYQTLSGQAVSEQDEEKQAHAEEFVDEFDEIKHLLQNIAGAKWRIFYANFQKRNINDDDVVIIFEDHDEMKKLIPDRRIRNKFADAIRKMISSDHSCVE